MSRRIIGPYANANDMAGEFDSFMRHHGAGPDRTPHAVDADDAAPPRFPNLHTAMTTPALDAFIDWAQPLIEGAAGSPAHALRLILTALVRPLSSYLGGVEEADRLVNGYIADVVNQGRAKGEPVTEDEALAMLTGLVFGIRIGQITSATLVLSGKPSVLLDQSTLDANGGLPPLRDKPAYAGMTKEVGETVGRTASPGSAKAKAASLLLELIRRAKAARTPDRSALGHE